MQTSFHFHFTAVGKWMHSRGAEQDGREGVAERHRVGDLHLVMPGAGTGKI